jgi:heptosyltransferase-2
VLGTKAEAQCATELVNKVNSPKLANFAGKTDIQDLIGILKKASLCISNDSGIMHLSAATGGAGIAIFGSTNPFATGPLSEKWMALYSNEECSPCLGRDCQFSHYNCLNNISPEDMIVAIILEKAVENRIHI